MNILYVMFNGSKHILIICRTLYNKLYYILLWIELKQNKLFSDMECLEICSY